MVPWDMHIFDIAVVAGSGMYRETGPINQGV